MIRREKIRKSLAMFFLCLLMNDIFLPSKALALTNGPAQPEAKQFAQAGTAEMVDLFTGDFKYNIPLLDVDGYPITLSYQGGVGMEDEASWAGLGWNVNVGAINRQLRGVPDDLRGDEVQTEHNVKPKITVGGRVTGRVELKGTDLAKVSGSISLGIFSDNYTGIGAEIGGNAGITVGLSGGGTGTSGLGLSAGLAFNSNSQTGVDLTPSISLAWQQHLTETNTGSAAISMNLGYNTRQGLKSLSLGTSYSVQGRVSVGLDLATSTFNYNTPPIYPRIQIPYRTVGRTFSGDFGGMAYAVFAGGGFTGYKTVREVAHTNNVHHAYGFMYASAGKNRRSAVMDFLREKDNVIIPSLPNLALPVSTPDMFSYTGQAGSGQFRLYSGTSGVFFDAEAKDETDNQTLGADVGLGAYVHGGVSFYKQRLSTVAGKWEGDNQYKNKGDFEDLSVANPREESMYFKEVGEKNVEDAGFTATIKGERPVWVDVNGKTAMSQFAYMDDALERKVEPISVGKVQKTGRQKRRQPITYLTALEAEKGGLDKYLRNYSFNNLGSFTPAACPSAASGFSRIDGVKRAHHLSEISVTSDDGRRMVYGLPVYNLEQQECTITLDPDKVAEEAAQIASTNLVTYKTGDKRTDQYYKKEKQPAHATSFLLTGVLSADYADRTGDGISDDDRGTAVKFNYSKLAANYKWRTPYEANKVSYNKGLYADKFDDKGSYVYGEKEIWYLHSIETKTKIAYFITADREDALGVEGPMGGKNTAVRQKRLAEIRLYSKTDPTKPIKTVVFKHNYSLCGGVPNTVSGGGKLTLESLYFTYGNSEKGKNHPYVFEYNNNQAYAYMASDRWGTLKPAGDNATDNFGAFRNDEFPYATRNPAAANANAAMWLLKKIALPGGGEVSVEYESDDYAYVQNKRAMEMIRVEGLYKGVTAGESATLRDAEWVRLRLTKKPASTTNLANWFRRQYLDNSKQLYLKMFVNVTDAPAQTHPDYFDFVSAYAEVADAYMGSASDDYIYIKMRPVDGKNPLLVAAWQKMKLEYPMYAYPGYKNRVQDDRPVEAVLSAVINSFATLNELNENFNERAWRKVFASTVNFDKSFARVVRTDGKRLGGGSRVKKVKISDKWATMTNTAVNETAVYGQEYTYRTTVDGTEISSGVASYEPAVGGDENPLHQPIPYTENIKGALSNYLYLEEPFGESLFPAPVVGYSKVIVRDLDESGNADPEKMTGYTQHEFYTARDYPVITKHSSIETRNRHPNGFSNFVGGHELHELAMTQGYTVILNDMHGKPKADRVYNKSGAEIGSTVFYYADENLDAGTRRLNNLAYTVNEKGEVSAEKVVIGREMEFFTDMREEEMSNKGQSVHIGVDVIPFIWFPLPIPHWPVRNNDEYRLFRSASATKVAQYYGVLNKVVKTDNGSTITTSNLIYDEVTGEPVLSSTTNEFDDPVYSLQVPAHWAYRQMGGAYQNINTVLRGFQTGAKGVINTQFTPYLSPGDELISVSGWDNRRFWVISSETSTTYTKEFRLIDQSGATVSNYPKQDMKIIRSGYRNVLNAAAASIVSLDNPVRNNSIQFDNAEMSWMRVLDARAAEYDGEWSVPTECATCPPGTIRQSDGSCTYQPVENFSYCFTFCQGSENSEYSRWGAKLYNTAGSGVGLLTSSFWANEICMSSNRAAKVSGSASAGEDSLSAPSPLVQKTSSLMGGTSVVAMSIPTSCERSDYTVTTQHCGRLSKTRIWLCTTPKSITGDMYPFKQWIGAETCFDVPASGYYYVGMGGDNAVKAELKAGGTVYFQKELGSDSAFKYWHLFPTYLPAGRVSITTWGKNISGPAGFGAEVYQATAAQLQADQPEAILFSTANLTGKPVQAYIQAAENSATYYKRYTSCSNGEPVDACGLANCGPAPVNPYVAGYLGNWRLWKEQAHIVGRKDNGVLDAGTKGVRVRNSGHYSLVPWWYYNTSLQKWDKSDAYGSQGGKWVTSRTVLLYNKAGTEIETRDALGRPGAAIYGFEDLLPTAVAANALNREIFYEGFEDFAFRDNCTPEPVCDGFFDIKQAIGGSYYNFMNSDDAHSGNYSLYMGNGFSLRTNIHTRLHKTSPGTNTEYLQLNTKGEYVKRATKGLYNNGFAPMAKKYVFAAWVKDGQPASGSPGINLSVGNSSIPLNVKAVVEGWKLVEGTVDLSAGSYPPDLYWNVSGSYYTMIDDIRIFPYDAHIKSYAYDEKTLRLMAEMDENNFATFYEYDEEGSLIRLKKETARGIMTLKETRSALSKYQQ